MSLEEIQIYLFEDDQAWFEMQDIKTLFDTTDEEIDKTINNIPKSDYPQNPFMEFKPIEKDYVMNIVNWCLVKLIRETINSKEVKEHNCCWITLMAEEHDKNVSNEFNENINQILNPKQKPSSQN